MKSNGEGERANEQRTVRGRGRGGGWGGDLLPSLLPLNSCESTITVSTAAPRSRAHFRAALIWRATPPPPLRSCCISTSCATKCSQPRGNCASGRMELLTIGFMSDPDPSQESGGPAVTPPGRCFPAERRSARLLCFISASVLRPSEVHPHLLSASASGEGGNRRSRRSISGRERKVSFRIPFASEPSGTAAAPTARGRNRSLRDAFRRTSRHRSLNLSFRSRSGATPDVTGHLGGRLNPAPQKEQR